MLGMQFLGPWIFFVFFGGIFSSFFVFFSGNFLAGGGRTAVRFGRPPDGRPAVQTAVRPDGRPTAVGTAVDVRDV